MIRFLISSSPSRAAILARNSTNYQRFLTTAADDAKQKAYDDFLAKLSPARKKFFQILHEYRNKNFNQSTNTRFFKMIIDAVDVNKDNVITKEEYQKLLQNIGAEEKMTKEDLDAIFDELGVGKDDKVIPVEVVKKSWEPLLKVVWRG
jgi:hypothetical protein